MRRSRGWRAVAKRAVADEVELNPRARRAEARPVMPGSSGPPAPPPLACRATGSRRRRELSVAGTPNRWLRGCGGAASVGASARRGGPAARPSLGRAEARDVGVEPRGGGWRPPPPGGVGGGGGGGRHPPGGEAGAATGCKAFLACGALIDQASYSYMESCFSDR